MLGERLRHYKSEGTGVGAYSRIAAHYHHQRRWFAQKFDRRQMNGVNSADGLNRKRPSGSRQYLRSDGKNRATPLEAAQVSKRPSQPAVGSPASSGGRTTPANTSAPSRECCRASAGARTGPNSAMARPWTVTTTVSPFSTRRRYSLNRS